MRARTLKEAVQLAAVLLIHPDLFAQTHFRLFCWRYDLLSCIKPLHLRSNVQQVLNKNYCLRLFGLQP